MNGNYEDELKRKGSFTYRNTGTSMMPLLRQDQDLFVIEQIKDQQYKKYDAVLFKRSNGQYVLHRILKVKKESFVLCGDHQYQKEYGITQDQILGKMTKVIRNQKEIDENNVKYRLYVHLWCDFFFVRSKILWVKEKSGRLKNQKTSRWIRNTSGKNDLILGILIFIQALLGISSVGYAFCLKKIVDLAVLKNRDLFWDYVMGFIILVAGQVILRAIHRHTEEYAKATFENKFKTHLFSKLLWGDYATVQNTHTGDWMNRLTSDTVIVAEGKAQILPGVIGMTVKMSGALMMLVWLEPFFSAAFLAGGIGLTCVTYFFRKKLKILHKRVQESDGRLRIFFQENLSSMTVVRSFVQEKRALQEASLCMKDHKKARMTRNQYSNLCNLGFGIIMQGAYVVGAVYCGYQIMNGIMSYGTLLAMMQLIGQIQTPLANITGYLPKYYGMIASAERLMEIEENNSFEQKNADSEQVLSLEQVKEFYQKSFSKIELSNVSFSYSSKGLPMILEHFDLQVEKGDYIAFTGASGCGKSTLLTILMCLYPLNGGERKLLLNDRGECELSDQYRRLFAYVPQGNQLMKGSVREVVSFSAPNRKDEEAIWKALQISCGDDFVKNLKAGLDTQLGERGAGLSEGQMQRLAIARAIYSDHPILLLDEATSALDEETEKQLLQNLKNMTDKTVLIVTHRLSVLEICNKQIILE